MLLAHAYFKEYFGQEQEHEMASIEVSPTMACRVYATLARKETLLDWFTKDGIGTLVSRKERRQRTNSFGRATEPLDGTVRRFPEPRTAIIATFNENTLRSLVPGDNPFVGLDDTPPFRGATQNSGESPPPPLNARAMAEAKKGTGPRRIAAASNGPIQSSSSSDESANGDRQVGME